MTGGRLEARRAARATAASAKAGLTTERVVQAALQLIDDEGGFEEFSMRRLARTLHVTPMALYSHVRDRDELLSRVAGTILTEIALPDASAPWSQRLRDICTRYRETVRRHPTMAPFVSRALALHTAESRPFAETLLSALIDAGLREERLFSVYRSLVGAVSGFVQIEVETNAATDPDAAPPSGDVVFEGLIQLLVSGIRDTLPAKD